MGGSRRLPRQPAAASRLHPLARPEGCVQAGRGAAVVCEGEAERVEEREDVPDGGAGGVEELLTAAARAAEELLRAAATTTAGPVNGSPRKMAGWYRSLVSTQVWPI